MRIRTLVGFILVCCCQMARGGGLCDPAIDCSGNGVCLADDTCQCDVGWSGAACALPVCEQPCINGTCTASDVCTCEPGWSGLTCGNGVCVPNCVMGFCVGPDFCACLDGWGGSICDVPVCTPACVNGSCTAPAVCSCVSGWTGALCDVPICEPSCVNGSCVAPDTCVCDVGYVGLLCDQDIDECVSDPCDVNATCTNSPGSFSCACNSGFTGTGASGDCQDIDECAADPCPLNATCTNLPGSFGCACDPGWTGSNCDVPICDPFCVNGVCVAPATCACDIGWTGNLCDTPTCTPACVNGTCTAPDTCVCDPGFGGIDCSIFLGERPTIDIKPGACPNLMSRKSRGVLQVAIVAPEGFDVTRVDPNSLLLFRADGVGAAVSPLDGPPGPGTELIDVATPFEGAECGCHDLEDDGTDDLRLRFRVSAIVEAFDLTALRSGAIVDLVLSGDLFDGTSFEGCDAIRILGRAEACGDGVCGPKENCKTCPADCGACAPGCGNGRCGRRESCTSCPADCGKCPE